MAQQTGLEPVTQFWSLMLYLASGTIRDRFPGHWTTMPSKSIPFDTTPESAQIQHEMFRHMSTVQRLTLALEMSESVRNIAAAGLRSRHPELTDSEISRELLRIMYGYTPQP